MSLAVDDLRAFRILAVELHYRKASEKLNVSQPALTRVIQRLERQVGGALLARTRRKVALTEAGRALLPFADRIVEDTGHALERVREVVQGRAGTLRVGFGIASVHDILPRAILRFRKAYPDVDLYLRDMSTASQCEALLRGDIDLGIVRYSAKPSGSEGFPLFSERLMLAAPRSFPCTVRKGLAGLAGAPFVMLMRSISPTFHEHVLDVCRQAGFAPRVVQEAGEMFTILNLVRSGVGVALIPRSASRMNVPGLQYHELRHGAATWRIGPVWMPDSGKIALISRFCEALRAVV